MVTSSGNKKSCWLPRMRHVMTKHWVTNVVTKKRRNGMLSNDIKDKMSAVQYEWRGLFTPDYLILSHGVRNHVLTRKCFVNTQRSV